MPEAPRPESIAALLPEEASTDGTWTFSARAISHAAIARRAFEIYTGRGRVDGFDLDDWLQAERELWVE
jgi:hypothetical protein